MCCTPHFCQVSWFSEVTRSRNDTKHRKCSLPCTLKVLESALFSRGFRSCTSSQYKIACTPERRINWRKRSFGVGSPILKFIRESMLHCVVTVSRFVFILLQIDQPRTPWTAGRQVSQLKNCTYQKNQNKQAKCHHAQGRFTCSLHMRHSGHTCKMQHTHTQSGIRLTHPTRMHVYLTSFVEIILELGMSPVCSRLASYAAGNGSSHKGACTSNSC